MTSLKKIEASSGDLKVLADQTRLSVLAMLMDNGMYVSEIINILRMDPTLLSHHLRILRDHGLVRARREGKTVHYEIDKRRITVKNGKGTIVLASCVLTVEAVRARGK